MQIKNHLFRLSDSEIPIRIISLSDLTPICQDPEKPLSIVEVGKLSFECNFECPQLAREFLTGEKSLGKRERRIVRRWRTKHKAYKISRSIAALPKKLAAIK